MTGDWRDYRIAIWTAMLGVALLFLVSPPYLGGLLLGMSIGLVLRIRQRVRRRARIEAGRTRRRPGVGRTKGPSDPKRN